MKNMCSSSSDEDMLVVPEVSTLRFQTKLGDLVTRDDHINVITWRIRFAVLFVDQEAPGRVIYDKAARGYMLEVYSGSCGLPTLELIGSNGLANFRDYRYPTESFSDEECEFLLITKF